MTKIGIIEDNIRIRESVEMYFNNISDFECSFAFGSMEDFEKSDIDLNEIDVVLIDIGLPGKSGIQGITMLKTKCPDIDIIMFTIYHDPDKIFNSLMAGASGYLLKNTPLSEMQQSIESLSSGGAPMSPEIARKVIGYFNKKEQLPIRKSSVSLSNQEQEVVNGLVDGLSYKMIADRMDLSVETIRSYIKNIYKKLHVHSKSEVVAKVLRGEI